MKKRRLHQCTPIKIVFCIDLTSSEDIQAQLKDCNLRRVLLAGRPVLSLLWGHTTGLQCTSILGLFISWSCPMSMLWGHQPSTCKLWSIWLSFKCFFKSKIVHNWHPKRSNWKKQNNQMLIIDKNSRTGSLSNVHCASYWWANNVQAPLWANNVCKNLHSRARAGLEIQPPSHSLYCSVLLKYCTFIF